LDRLLLKGEVTAHDGELTLFQQKAGPSGGGESPLNFDLLVQVGKNMYIETGGVGGMDVAMDLNVKGENLHFSGKVSSPKLAGKVVFERGKITILGREFVLLSGEEQKKYFQFEGIGDNTAVFQGEGVNPSLYIVASARVAPSEQVAKNYQVKEIIVISKLSGVPNSLRPEQAINLTFSAFYEDKALQKIEKLPLPEDDIKALLLPDFIRSWVGTEASGQGNATFMAADYFNAMVKQQVFKPLERKLQTALGLESLSFEYNIGEDLKKGLGGGSADTGARSRLSLGLMKGFFDKLYIDMRYSEGFEQTAGNESSITSSFNYQLIYRLDRIWSIAYYREPASMMDLNSGIYKTTLNAGFSY